VVVVEGREGAATPQRSAPHSRHPISGGMTRQQQALAGQSSGYDAALVVTARSPPRSPTGRMAAAR
jgi:hypothetical protein